MQMKIFFLKLMQEGFAFVLIIAMAFIRLLMKRCGACQRIGTIQHRVVSCVYIFSFENYISITVANLSPKSFYCIISPKNSRKIILNNFVSFFSMTFLPLHEVL